MMRFLSPFLILLIPAAMLSQEEKPKIYPPPMIARDSLYREDQFYAGFTYNILTQRPSGVSQRKFSAGFFAGFLRDMPINKRRNKAFAAGIGGTYNKYFNDLVVFSEKGQGRYALTAPGYEKNKLDHVFVDIPIEYRWRTSTPDTHKFWRVYGGIKLSYLVMGKARYIDDVYDIRVTNIRDFNKFQAGAYITAGNNTFNIYAHYGITALFRSSAKLDGETIGMHALNLGLIFYIL